MSLQRIRSRIGAVICSLALLAIGVVVGLAANQASAATSSAAAVNSGGVVMLAPCRVADSRQRTTLTPFFEHATEYLGVTGTCGVPSGAAGAILSITVVPPWYFSYGGGYVTVYPDSVAQPNVSQISFNRYNTSGEVTVQLSPRGWIAIYNGSPDFVDIIVDVSGYIVA